MTNGLVYVFTGDGKGKTSAALGVATRAALIGKQVVWISFYKGQDWDLAEKHLPEKIESIEMHFVGKGFHINESKNQRINQSTVVAKVAGGRGVVVDTASSEEHKMAAQDGLKLAEMVLQRTDPCFLLVLDEILNAVTEGLLEENDVQDLVSKRGMAHVVLTGRSGEPTRRLLEGADLVTECKKVKHPYDSGKLAVRGLDF